MIKITWFVEDLDWLLNIDIRITCLDEIRTFSEIMISVNNRQSLDIGEVLYEVRLYQSKRYNPRRDTTFCLELGHQKEPGSPLFPYQRWIHRARIRLAFLQCSLNRGTAYLSRNQTMLEWRHIRPERLRIYFGRYSTRLSTGVKHRNARSWSKANIRKGS